MALLRLLAVVMFEFLPRLQSTRKHRGISHVVQSSGHFEDADIIAVAHDEELLACEEVETKARFIIQAKDQPFVDYSYDVWGALTINCKTFTLPPKPSSMLKNLATQTLPEDVIGLIGSFNHDVHCGFCELLSFNMTQNQWAKCRTALTQNQWARVHREVKEEGGSCRPHSHFIEAEERSLQTCMTSAKANQVAVCRVDSDRRTLLSIKKKERQIKIDEDAIHTRQEIIKIIKETPEFIQKKQENIKDLQERINMHRQNNVYLKQIFEGP